MREGQEARLAHDEPEQIEMPLQRVANPSASQEERLGQPDDRDAGGLKPGQQRDDPPDVVARTDQKCNQRRAKQRVHSSDPCVAQYYDYKQHAGPSPQL
jgi:hypothetical protein